LVETGYDRVQIDRLRLQDLLTAECQELASQPGGPCRGVPDLLGILPQRIGLPQAIEEELCVPLYRSEDIVEIMRHRTGQTPYRLHLLRVSELRLTLRQRLLRLLARRRVTVDTIDMRRAILELD